MSNGAYLTWMVLGFGCAIIGVVVGKITVYRINSALNVGRTAPNQKPGWTIVVDKNNGDLIQEYRRTYPEGPLNQGLILTWVLMGFGLLVVIGSSVADRMTR